MSSPPTRSGGFAQGTAYASELMVSGTFHLAQLIGSGLGDCAIVLTAREGSSLSANDVGNIFTVQEIYGDGLTPRFTELSYDQPFRRQGRFVRGPHQHRKRLRSVVDLLGRHFALLLLSEQRRSAVRRSRHRSTAATSRIRSSAWGARLKVRSDAVVLRRSRAHTR